MLLSHADTAYSPAGKAGDGDPVTLPRVLEEAMRRIGKVHACASRK